jgi:hypothetical protein
MRVLATALAGVAVLGSALAAVVPPSLAALCSESCNDYSWAPVYVLVLLCLGAMLTAVALLVAVAAGSRRGAEIAWAAHAILAVALFLRWPGQLGRDWGFVIEACALAALVLSRVERSRRDEQRRPGASASR